MESYEVLNEAFEKAGPKEVAKAMGVSLSLVYKWAQPPGVGKTGGIANPLDRVEELMRATRHVAVIKWLCQRFGGYFVANPRTTEEPRGLVPATNEIIQQFADLLAAISEAAADHKITKAETRLIRKHWDDLKTVTEGFVRACEDGDFERMHRPQLRPEGAVKRTEDF